VDAGAAIFFTDYSISPAELGVALEEGGFESLCRSRSSGWRRSGTLIERYRDAGVARVIFNLPAAQAGEVLPILDRCASLLR
jgi:hypothetical protein